MAEERKLIDARGSLCPGPLMALIKNIKRAPIGAEFEVWSSDKGTRRDLPKWVEKAKHELIEIVEEDDYNRFIVRKAR
ncbi:MAG: sulfurtransferase TusA family protein [Candidatus Heimdallarchaeota archaeon]